MPGHFWPGIWLEPTRFYYFLRRERYPLTIPPRPNSESSGSGEAVCGSLPPLAFWSAPAPAEAAFWSLVEPAAAAFWSEDDVLELD
jgi:hypothetical protein